MRIASLVLLMLLLAAPAEAKHHVPLTQPQRRALQKAHLIKQVEAQKKAIAERDAEKIEAKKARRMEPIERPLPPFWGDLARWQDTHQLPKARKKPRPP